MTSASRALTLKLPDRFEMWRTALLLSNEHPLLGIGRSGYMEEKQDLAAEGKIGKMTRDYTNAHNDYLDTLVKRGAVGTGRAVVQRAGKQGQRHQEQPQQGQTHDTDQHSHWISPR